MKEPWQYPLAVANISHGKMVSASDPCRSTQSTGLQLFFLPFLGFCGNLLHGVQYRRKGFATVSFLFFFLLSVRADFPFHGQISVRAGDMARSVGTDRPRNAGRVIPAASRQREEKPSSRTPVSIFFFLTLSVENAWDFGHKEKFGCLHIDLGFLFRSDFGALYFSSRCLRLLLFFSFFSFSYLDLAMSPSRDLATWGVSGTMS